ncbi:MAG TPA: DUF1365 domain-containing protein [Solirubrobacteraceae bacterium]|nr:DUF1365 domain-containing protein [Solirubrobacteraceae bacterium]
MQSCLYEGVVRHRRSVQVASEMRYPLFMAYLDLGELDHVFDCSCLFSSRRPALAWFRRADYLGDPARPLEEEVRRVVLERTGARLDGPVRVLTHMRCFGHCFNPVTFYYCFERDGGALAAAVAEVTNTPWGERHAYVLGPAQLHDHGSTRVLRGRLAKQLHVSPLMGMDHTYDLRVSEPGSRLALHIESLHADGEHAFDATLALRRREITAAELRRALARYPLLTMRMLAHIYAGAARLRARGASYHPHPAGSR